MTMIVTAQAGEALAKCAVAMSDADFTAVLNLAIENAAAGDGTLRQVSVDLAVAEFGVDQNCPEEL